MSKNWDRENMKTLAANVRKEDAEAFAKIAKENNTTVGGMLRMFIRDSVQKTAGKPEPLSGVGHVVSYKNTDRLKHEVAFHNPDHLDPNRMLNRILDLENSDIASAYHWFRMILVDKILPDTQIKSYIVNEDEWLIKNKDLDVQQEKKYFVLTEGKKLLQLESTLSCEENNQWSYVYNPKNPVPSHGGESLLWSWDDIGSLKQPPCGWRDDVLSFVSEPLSQDMIVLGSIKVELYVSSDASDTAFSAKLMEIRPDGSAYHVRSGITTLAYRSGADFPRGVYKAGQMVKVEINFWDIGWCFKTGTRLRLDISSSDFPQYSIHSNYPGVWSVQTKTKPAVQTVYSCPGNTSAIIFPIISNK